METNKKVKVGDKYIIPAGTQLWFIDLQQSLITTKKYVIEVTNTVVSDDVSFFGELYEITFEHYGIPGLRKVLNGSTQSSLDRVQEITNELKPKILQFVYKQ